MHEKFELNVGHQIEAMAHFLEETFENKGLTVETIEGDDIFVCLEKYIQSKKPDIFAISKHHKTVFEKLFLPSVSKRFVQMAKLPILCFTK